jgi:hypothetical protein
MSISDRLSELARFYDREANKCVTARAYLAASIMQAAALEASLQAMCFLYPGHVKRTKTHLRKRFRGKRNRALEFSLNELINIAAELAWFPPKAVTFGHRRTNLTKLVHQVREIRNLVHPGKWAREHPGTTAINKRLYIGVGEVFDVATSWLLQRVEQSLLKAMKRRGLS